MLHIPLILAFTAPAFGGPSFPCEKAATPTEHAICNSEGLSKMDARIADAYQFLRQRFPKEKKELLETQKAWLAKREKCGADETCLRKSFYERDEQIGDRAFGIMGVERATKEGKELRKMAIAARKKPKVFRSDEFGFEVKYPGYWNLTETRAGNSSASADSSAQPLLLLEWRCKRCSWLTLEISPPERCSETQAGEAGKEKVELIGGVEFKVTSESEAGLSHWDAASFYTAQRNGLCFHFRNRTDGSSNFNTENERRALKLNDQTTSFLAEEAHDQIIRSLRFLKK